MPLPNISDIKAIAGNTARDTSEYETRGTVTKVSGDTVFVRFDGSEIETPVDTTCVNVRPGDVVSVHVSHLDTHIVGNRTSPSQTERGTLAAISKHTSGLRDDVSGLIRFNSELEHTARGWDFIITAEEAEERFDPIGSAGLVASRVDEITGTDNEDGTHTPGALDQLTSDIRTLDESTDAALSEAVAGINTQISETNQNVSSLQGDMTRVVTHIRIGDVGEGMDAGIKIYADGNQESLTLKKDSITFFDGEPGATEITNRELNITNASVSDYLRFGKWAFFHRDSNDNMSIKWIGN